MRRTLVILFALCALTACKNQSVKYEEPASPTENAQEAPKTDKKADDSKKDAPAESPKELKIEEAPKV